MAEKSSALDFVMAKSAAPSQENVSEWKWNCSNELRNILESMGLFEVMESQMEIICTSQNKRIIDLAKMRIDAINKSISIFKAATAVHKDSGAEDIQEGIGEITISLTRNE